MSDNLHLVDYLFIDNPFPALKFSGSIGGHWPAITQFPAYWPQCLQKIQKSMATSGLPSRYLKVYLKCLKSLNSSVVFVKFSFGDDQLN